MYACMYCVDGWIGRMDWIGCIYVCMSVCMSLLVYECMYFTYHAYVLRQIKLKQVTQTLDTILRCHTPCRVISVVCAA